MSAPEEYWTRRDGSRIAVGNMDVDHLRNALRMTIRRARRRLALTMVLQQLNQIEAYAEDAPDGAVDAVRLDIREMWSRLGRDLGLGNSD